MTLSILAILIGIVAGLRPLTALAAIAWGAWMGGIDLSEGWLSFLGYGWSPWVFSLAAITEFVVDKLRPEAGLSWRQRFFTRLGSGAICGAAIGSIGNLAIECMGWGVAGAAIGVFASAWLLKRLAAVFGDARPAGLVEDMLAIGGAAAAVAAL